MAGRTLRSSADAQSLSPRYTVGGVRGPVLVEIEFDNVGVRLTKDVRPGELLTTFDGVIYEQTKGPLLRMLNPDVRLYTANGGIIRGFTVDELSPTSGAASVVEVADQGTNCRFRLTADGRVWLVATSAQQQGAWLRAQAPVGSDWSAATTDESLSAITGEVIESHLANAMVRRMLQSGRRRHLVRASRRNQLLRQLMDAPAPSAEGAVEVAAVILNRVDEVQLGLEDVMSPAQFTILCDALAINTRLTAFRLLGNVHWMIGAGGVRQAEQLGDAIAVNDTLQDLNFGENTDGRRGLMSLVPGTRVSLLEVLLARFEHRNTSVWTMFLERIPEDLRPRITVFLARNRANYVPNADNVLVYRNPATRRLTSRVKIQSDHSGRWTTAAEPLTWAEPGWWTEPSQCRKFDCVEPAVTDYFLCYDHTRELAHVHLLHPDAPVATDTIAGTPDRPLALVPLDVYLQHGGSASVPTAVTQRARMLSDGSFDVYIPAGLVVAAAVRVFRAGEPIV